MIKLKNVLYFICVSLSFTGIYFFKMGLAKFTLFHALAFLALFYISFSLAKREKFMIKMPRYFVLLLMYLIVVNLSYIYHIKATSFIYSLVIMLELLLLINITRKFDTVEIVEIIKIIILIYFLNILVASTMILFKINPIGILDKIFQIYDFDGRMRPYGFSDEPSYAAIILVFSMYVLFKAGDFKYQKGEFKWYAMGSLAVLLTRSTYGYMLLALILFVFTIKSNILFIHLNNIVKNRVFSLRQVLLGGAVSIILFVVLLSFLNIENFTSINRLVTLSKSFTKSADQPEKAIENIAYVDGSASMRILPTLYLVDNFKSSPVRYILFGRGAGQSTNFFSGIYEGNTTLLGFIPSFVYNYGLVGTFLFFLFFLRLFPRKKSLLLILFLFFIFNADFNTQIFLYVLFTVVLSHQIEINRASALKGEEHA
jgi:hypothetical protein